MKKNQINTVFKPTNVYTNKIDKNNHINILVNLQNRLKFDIWTAQLINAINL